MKKSKFIALLSLMIILGGLAIILPNFFFNHDKVQEKAVKEEVKKVKTMSEISSNSKTTVNPEIGFDNQEPEQIDKNQMYFENIEVLYKYYKLAQVEYIKQQLQFYIHNNINKELKECSLNQKSFKLLSKEASFDLNIKGVRSFSVDVQTVDDTTLKVTISHIIN